MTKADREIARSRELLKESRQTTERFRRTRRRLRKVLDDSRTTFGHVAWSRFFGYSDNADRFFKSLDKKTKNKMLRDPGKQEQKD